MFGNTHVIRTIGDFLRFCQMLLNKGEQGGVRLLSAKTVEMMTKNGLSDPVLQQRGASINPSSSSIRLWPDRQVSL